MSEWRDRVSSSDVEEPLWLDNRARRYCGARSELGSSELDGDVIDTKHGKQEDSEAWRASNQDIEFMVSERSGRAGGHVVGMFRSGYLVTGCHFRRCARKNGFQ